MRGIARFIALVGFGLLPFAAAAQNAPTQAAPATAPSAAPAAHVFNDAERAEIGEVIKEYLTKRHPEVLLDAMKELQKRDQDTAESKSEAAIKGAYDKIYKDPLTPVGGNPNGSVTMVEFFDYQCGYCKMSEPEVEKVLAQDKDVKFIYKDFPILGPMSVAAAKASLAAARQGTDKYIKFHDALMGLKEHLNDDLILQTAKGAGLDIERLKKDMDDDAIGKQVKGNVDLGEEIGVRGTPMFIIGETVYPGALQYEQLKKAVDDVRAAEKKK